MHCGGKSGKQQGGVAISHERQASGEEEENGVSGVVESIVGEGKEPTLLDLAVFLQAHMEQQEAREAKKNERVKGKDPGAELDFNRHEYILQIL